MVSSSFNLIDDANQTVDDFKMAFDNFWGLTQAQIDISDATAGLVGSDDELFPQLYNSLELDLPKLSSGSGSGQPPLVLTGLAYDSTKDDANLLGTVPVVITHGSDDYSFNVIINYNIPGANSSSSAEADSFEKSPFYNASQVGHTWFIDDSLGLIRKVAGSRWVQTPAGHWLYPETSDAPDLWIYAQGEDDWYYVPRDEDSLGWIWKQRTQMWYYLDRKTLRHVPFQWAADS